MRRKILAISMIIMLVVCMSPIAFATSTQDKLDSVQDQKKDVADDLSSLTSQLKTQQAAIDKLQKTIDAKESSIAKTQAELNLTKKKITARKEGLELRLRTMYKNGSVGYVDVLLSSNSISDFLSNIEMVQKIYKNDQQILSTLKSQKAEIETKEAKLQKEKSELDSTQATMTSKKQSLQAVKKKLKSKYDELTATENKLKAQIAAATSGSNVTYHGGSWAWPSNTTTITSYFGYRNDTGGVGSTYHQGIDIGASYGSPVYAAKAGKVVIAGWYGGYGKLVAIYHGNGITTYYGHNSSISVSVGQTVSKGQVISHVGSTGWSTGPHLHFGVLVNGSFVNPLKYY
jgi:Membrane-bound metallopeptidase